MPNMEVLGSLVTDLHQSLSQLFYLMLPIGIILSVAFSYFKSGDPNYPDILKRALVASLLLATFPEISNLILDICDGLAAKIDNMNGLDTFLRMAQEKSQSYSTAKNVLLLKFDDLFIAILSFGSFIILLVARYITVALYYFFWVLLSILSPLMILAYIFPETAGITKNLYRGLMEVAAWKILWAVMSAMLTSLSYGNIYKTEGSYLTLIILNFVIAIALLCTPLMMKALVGDGIQGMAQTLGTAAAMSVVSIPLKIRQAKEIAVNPRGYLSSKIKTYNEPNNRR
jgi:hypothetical protein